MSFDIRKHGLIVVKGKGSKERRIARGIIAYAIFSTISIGIAPMKRNFPNGEAAEKDHLFLSETRRPLSVNGMTLLFARLRKRSGINGQTH